ncbi:MAG: hypothetical protein ACI9Z4_002325 [Polaribacter sp.]|jgi:hypothetical protein
MNVIITGSSGMVGKGVLLECLTNKKIKSILIINRSSIGIKHSKLKEVLLKDFTKISTISKDLEKYDACFFCMGTSSVGMNTKDYTSITFDITKAFVDAFYILNPAMVFNYVSGSRTDDTEQSKTMWARVKGKTENYILNKGFKDAYMFRPGVIIPEKGIKPKTQWYRVVYAVLSPFIWLLKTSKTTPTTTKVGLAMIHTLFHSQSLKHLENKDIILLADKKL